MTIIEPKKCVGLSESKFEFIDWKWKLLVLLKPILYPDIYVSESVTLLALPQKVQTSSAWKGNMEILGL